jgi:prevent-host-death family protein
MIQQFVSVTEARARLKELIDSVVAGKSRVILVRDSKPEVALVRYDDMVRQEEISEQEWQKRWDDALKEGKKAGRRWAKERGIDLKKVTEEELYDLIAKETRSH